MIKKITPQDADEEICIKFYSFIHTSSENVFGDYSSSVTKLAADGESMVLVFNKLAKEGRQIPKMTYHAPTTYLPFSLLFITNKYYNQ